MYQSDRIADDLDGRGHRTKILLDDKSSRFDLRVHKHLMHLVDRSGRNALDLEGTQQLELRQGADLLAQDRNQRSAFRTRSAFPLNKGSVESSGRPSAAAKRANWASLPTAITTCPSLVANAW